MGARNRPEAVRGDVEGNQRRLATVLDHGARGQRFPKNRVVERGHAFGQVAAEAADMADRERFGGCPVMRCLLRGSTSASVSGCRARFRLNNVSSVGEAVGWVTALLWLCHEGCITWRVHYLASSFGKVIWRVHWRVHFASGFCH